MKAWALATLIGYLNGLVNNHLPDVVKTLETWAISKVKAALIAAKAGTFPDQYKAYEPFFDSLADVALVELAKIEAALVPPANPS